MANSSHRDVGGAEHVSRAKDPAIVEKSRDPFKWTRRGIRAVVLLGIVVSMGQCFHSYADKRQEKKDQRANAVSAQQVPTPVQQQQVVIDTSRVVKSFRFHSGDWTNCGRVILTDPRAEWFIQGGDSLAVHPPSREVWYDKAGIYQRRSLEVPSGSFAEYIFCQAGSANRGLDILARW